MDFIEVTGKDKNDAIMNAAQQFGTPSENLEIEVIDEGSLGFLGMFAKPAKIRARRKEETEETEVKPAVKETKKQVSEPKEKIKESVEPAETTRVKETISEDKVKEVVNKFLGDVFHAMDMQVKIVVAIDKEEDTVNVDLSGDEMGLLIGKRGQTLDSLQYLLRLVVNKEIGGYIKVKIDTEDYRKRRKETLESLAKNIAFKVKRTRSSVELEPMNPYERRIIHSALQNDKYVATKSEGEEPYRHVVVYLKKPVYGGNGGYGGKRYGKPYNKNYNKDYRHRENSETAVTSENK